jgi:hypothetical protein
VFFVQLFSALENPFRKGNMNYGIVFAPVPVIVKPQSPEQVLVAFKGLLQGIDEQGFAEPAGSGEKIVDAAFSQLMDHGGLVHIRISVVDDLAEVLTPMGNFFIA